MIVRTIDRIRTYIPVNKSLDYDKIKPFIVESEGIVKGIISEDMYDKLDDYISSRLAEEPAEANESYEKLIELLRDSIAYQSFNLGFDIINTVFSDQGFHRIENEQSGKKSLFQRQEENLRKTFARSGWNKLEIALAYMEKNKSAFTEWVQSTEYSLSKDRFINSATEFNSFYNINNNRLVFIKLRNAQILAEDFDIKPLLGQEYFAELKTQILSGSLSNANKTFLPYLQKAVAQLTIVRGGYELMLELNEYGFYEKAITAVENNFKTESLARESFFKEILEKAELNGKAYLEACEKILKQNITNYPTYAGSSAYHPDGDSFNIKGTDKIVVI